MNIQNTCRLALFYYSALKFSFVPSILSARITFIDVNDGRRLKQKNSLKIERAWATSLYPNKILAITLRSEFHSFIYKKFQSKNEFSHPLELRSWNSPFIRGFCMLTAPAAVENPSLESSRERQSEREVQRKITFIKYKNEVYFIPAIGGEGKKDARRATEKTNKSERGEAEKNVLSVEAYIPGMIRYPRIAQSGTERNF